MQVMINAIATGRNDSEQDAYSKEEQASQVPPLFRIRLTQQHCIARLCLCITLALIPCDKFI